MRQRSLKSRITDPSETTLAWVLLTPAILFLLLIVAYPVSKLIYNSFFDIRLSGGGMPSFVGLENYKLALEDSLFWKSLKNTIIITVVTVPGALVAGLGLAMLANMPFKYRWPVRLALLDVWYRNFHGFTSRSIAPYHSALRRLPAYLQQLEMESNGKRVDASGAALPFGTSPVLWGEPGTNGQHAYFQMLHQGTDVVPVEFVAVKQPRHTLAGHHPMLLANVLAQAQALMVGKTDAGGHKHFPGNRPSTFLLLDDLTPAALGALIALQEHRVFVSGSLWGINSFDQWGVELGKELATGLLPVVEGKEDAAGRDASTAGLVRHMRELQ